MQQSSPVSVRLPIQMSDWLKDQAKANCRSLSGEVIFLIKAKQAELAALGKDQ